MRSKSFKSFLQVSFALCVAATSPLQAESVQDNSYRIKAFQTEQTKIRPLLFAGSPAVCKANYDQCMKGCGGAAQCSNQCQVNYNGCLH